MTEFCFTNPKHWLKPFYSLAAFSLSVHYLLIIYCLFAPLSIAISQTALIAIVAQWISITYFSPHARRILTLTWNKLAICSPRYMLRAMAAFMLVAFFSAGVGIDPSSSVFALMKSSIYLFVPPAMAVALYPTFAGRTQSSNTSSTAESPAFLLALRSYLISLAIGVSIAALASIVYAASEGRVSFGLPGPVTQSGQLALAVPCLIMLSLIVREVDLESNRESKATLWRGLLVGLATLALAWSWKWQTMGGIVAMLLVCLLLALLFAERGGTKSSASIIVLAPRSLTWIGAIYLATLVVNLKRGPWLAVITEFVILGLLFSRRLALLTVSFGLLIFISLKPARDRLIDSFADFSVSGGRKTMWELGVELSQRFPLGLGPHNARFMQQLDPTLPELHRHMHNNLLNIAVETGWIGLGIFVWWMFVSIRLGFTLWRNSRNQTSSILKRVANIGLLASLALLGWQVAGIVEYNYGDSEVRMLALMIMGILLSSSLYCVKNQSRGNPPKV